MSNQVIERKPNGQFAKGVSGNLGGNAQRSRHALNSDTIMAMHAAFRRGGRAVGIPGGDGRGEVAEGVPLVVEGHRVGAEAPTRCGGDVGDLVTEDDRGAAVEVGKFNKRAPCRVGWLTSRVRRCSMSADAPSGERVVP